MQHLPIADALVPAPLAEAERVGAVREALARVGVHPSRFGHAHSTGLTITYVHVQPGDGPGAASVLAGALPWADTTLSTINNAMVAITTNRG